jgi:tRNA-Thr(GGU) m(6)t(6)A37 methyltransferase TsaA
LKAAFKVIGTIKRLNEKLSEVTVDQEYAKGLEGVEDLSHLFILYYMHKVPKDRAATLKAHVGGLMDRPMKGVFATRSQLRPNPIGLTLVQLRKRKGNVITVTGLDAEDGSPLLDIKPIERSDFASKLRYPDWWPEIEV